MMWIVRWGRVLFSTLNFPLLACHFSAVLHSYRRLGNHGSLLSQSGSELTFQEDFMSVWCCPFVSLELEKSMASEEQGGSNGQRSWEGLCEQTSTLELELIFLCWDWSTLFFVSVYNILLPADPQWHIFQWKATDPNMNFVIITVVLGPQKSTHSTLTEGQRS